MSVERNKPFVYERPGRHLSLAAVVDGLIDRNMVDCGLTPIQGSMRHTIGSPRRGSSTSSPRWSARLRAVPRITPDERTEFLDDVHQTIQKFVSTSEVKASVIDGDTIMVG
jgi:hypothetical protein